MTTQQSNGQARPGEGAGAVPAKDANGEPVEVVKRDIQDPNQATDNVDKAVTPTSIRSREQDAEKLQDKVSEVEKKLDR
ncbi:hypothetical protein PflQ2_1782 [Pseudomonas fluorescens Q2-87]|uniref:Uncharacterized protein n=1 Tax=Pseudomonas fluorescens (strain Q2-87) TaxID=1038922 RepID=J2F120_PSEFQ|nr:hypothetical protein [Pseudomonas fluorescens]EJL02633.1 hypothetical protein PflQ2_1782 [Pseudomonas fluorescens Q2-87]